MISSLIRFRPKRGGHNNDNNSTSTSTFVTLTPFQVNNNNSTSTYSTSKRSSGSRISLLSFYPVKAFAYVILGLVALVVQMRVLHIGNNDDYNVGGGGVTGEDDIPSSFLRGILSSDNDYRKFPRMVAIANQKLANDDKDDDRKRFLIDTSITYNNNNDVTYTKDFEHNSIPSNLPQITSDWYEPNFHSFTTGIYNPNYCKPANEWQSQSFPDCNTIHEKMDVMKMKFVARGTIQSVFEYTDEEEETNNNNKNNNNNNKSNKFVYKNLALNNGLHESGPKLAEKQRIDALILQSTTSSKFTPSIYGHCGTTMLMDYAPATLHFIHKRFLTTKNRSRSTTSSLDRLKISIHIASGVAALHSVNFIHNDIHDLQYLFHDGIFKLNDFNHARPIYVHTNSNATDTDANNSGGGSGDEKGRRSCTTSKFSMGVYGRSLEEMQKKVGYEGFTPVTPTSVDVWMMGYLLYSILTNLTVWDESKRHYMSDSLKLKMAKRIVAQKEGLTTQLIPQHILNSTDPSYRAMKKGLEMSWTYNWKDRPSAQMIADYLMGELRRITGDDNPDLRVEFK